MKIWTIEHVFDHSWDYVVMAALRKYPNPMNPSVIGVDCVDRIIDNGILKSHRLLISEWNLPSWIAKILGGNRTCYASEHSQIDRLNQTLSLRTRNLTLNNIINVDEKMVYSSHPTDKTKTILKQEATITVRNLPLIDYLESYLTSRINTNAANGRLAIEFIIHSMKNFE